MYQTVALLATAVCEAIIKILSSSIAQPQDTVVDSGTMMSLTDQGSVASKGRQHGTGKRIGQLVQAFRKSFYSRIKAFGLHVFSQ
jgi:hypothetical protein